jgi:surface antigen
MANRFKRLMTAALGVAALVAIPLATQAQRPAPPPLPEIPARPVMSQAAYPDCMYDYRQHRESVDMANETTRCIERLDAYQRIGLADFPQRMADHQQRVRDIYEAEVMDNFDYPQDQADRFFARTTQEMTDSNPDGPNMATYREMSGRYQEDRGFLQERFCRYSGVCSGYAQTAETAERDRADGTEQQARREGDDDEKNSCNTERAGGGILGGILGGVLGEATGVGAIGGFIVGQFAGILVAEIACQLEPEEQERVAEATEEVTAQEEVGATAAWVSPTRADVSGSSTVTALNSQPNGASCMDVTDVVIVSGEETRISKRMCRGPGEARYTLAA